MCIDGFNLLNEEVGLPKGKQIVAHGMGFCHDAVLVEDEAPLQVAADD